MPDDKITGSKAPSIITKYIESLLDTPTPRISDDVIMIFVSLDPDKRGKLYKLLNEKAQLKAFPIPSESTRREYIRQWLGEKHTPMIEEYLIAYV
jgi:Mg/Co/Ni transporter MgtE